MPGEKQRERERRSELAKVKELRKQELFSRGLKECLKCAKEKDLDDFYTSKVNKDGRRSHCISCMSDYGKSSSGKTASQKSLQRKRSNPEYRAKEASYGVAWRQKNPEKRRATEQRRRARKLDVVSEVVDNLIVFERDKWMCQLCKLPVDNNLKFPDPQSASLDHKIPLSKGGSHSYENTQLAHLRCNISKGAKLEEGVSPIARPCLTCEHASRDDIERDLRAGDRPAVIAERHTDLSEAAIRRHSQHMDTGSTAIVVRRGSETALEGALQTSGMIGELSNLYSAAQAVGNFAMTRGNEVTTLKALQTQLSVLDSLRKLSEAERGDKDAVANAGAAEDLRKLTTALRAVLPQFPVAGESLAVKLEELGEWQAAGAIRQLSRPVV